jgi:hypothetical protein
MIAADEKFSQLARALDDFIRAGPIADDIAQVDDEIISGSGRQARL